MDSDPDLIISESVPQYIIDAIAKMILAHISAEIEKT